jgi:hypothetical protein
MLCTLLNNIRESTDRDIVSFDSRTATTPTGARGGIVIEALCYKPEGREFSLDNVNEFSRYS